MAASGENDEKQQLSAEAARAEAVAAELERAEAQKTGGSRRSSVVAGPAGSDTVRLDLVNSDHDGRTPDAEQLRDLLSRRKEESETDPLIPDEEHSSSNELEKEQTSSIWPQGSFSAFLKTLSTRQLALWLFLASLMGGGIAAVVVTFGFPALTVVGIPSILGLGGIAVPLILVSVVGALITLATLMILERYITDKRTPFGLFIALVALSGIAFAALGLFVVATTPGLLGALTFGVGPYMPFVVAGAGLGVLAMVGAGIAYAVINRGVGGGEPGAGLDSGGLEQDLEFKEIGPKLDKSNQVELRAEFDERKSVEPVKPMTAKERAEREKVAAGRVLEEARGAKSADGSEDILRQLEIVESGLKDYPKNVDLLYKKAVLLCLRGGDGDYAQANGIFDTLKASPIFSRRSDMNKMAAFGRDIAVALFNSPRSGRGLEESKKQYVTRLMKQLEKELKKPSFGQGKDQKEARQDVLKLCVMVVQRIDPNQSKLRAEHYKQLRMAIDEGKFKGAICIMKYGLSFEVEPVNSAVESSNLANAVQSEVVHTPQPEDVGLPDGWRYIKTEDGNDYYWNDDTEESSWDRPEGSQPLAEPEPDADVSTEFKQ